MTVIEKTGRTVEEAIQEALNELGAERDAVDIEVLDEGSKGLFGLLGMRQARVKVSLRTQVSLVDESSEDTAEADETDSGGTDAEAEEGVDVEKERAEGIKRATEFVAGVLSRLGLELGIETRLGEEDIVHLNITGQNVGLIIGRHGQTLDALQYLANVVANRKPGPRIRIVLDAEGYRKRREETLTRLAHRTADRVIAQGRKIVLEPMNALERRVIHMALRTSPDVETYSEGEDPYRRVVIVPKNQ